MCGIAGFIGKKEISKINIVETLNLMKNRGPDFQSYFNFSHNNSNISLLLKDEISSLLAAFLL